MFDIKVMFVGNGISATGFLSKEPMDISAEQAETIRTRVQEVIESNEPMSIFTREEDSTEVTIPVKFRQEHAVMVTQIIEVKA